MVTFTKAQIESFSEEERKLFDNLAQRAHASIEDEGNDFDVKPYLAKKALADKENEDYQKQMENSLQVGHVTKQHF